MFVSTKQVLSEALLSDFRHKLKQDLTTLYYGYVYDTKRDNCESKVDMAFDRSLLLTAAQVKGYGACEVR